MKSQKNYYILIKILSLFTSLALVVLFYKHTISDEFKSAIKSAFYPGNEWNWCEGKAVTGLQDINLNNLPVMAEVTNQICKVFLTSVRVDEVKASEFKPILYAVFSDSNPVAIKTTASKRIFEIGGMYFYSEYYSNLTKDLIFKD